MKSVAGTLRIDLSQYRELEAFAKFGSDLDASTQRQLNRGERMVEILKQNEFSPLPAEEQVVIIYAATEGLLDEVPVEDIQDFEEALLERMRTQYEQVLDTIRESGKLSDDAASEIRDIVADVASTYIIDDEEEDDDELLEAL
jgi:F-type H+-transporting ATPase subunit alpha